MDQYPSNINVNSNHPKTIIKQVPKVVKMRIRSLSANEKIFQESSKIYKEALKNSVFKEEFPGFNPRSSHTKDSKNGT